MGSIFEKNITLKIVSIVVAIILWKMTPANQDPPRNNDFRDLPLNLINQEELNKKGLTLSADPPDTINIVLWGKYSEAKNLDRKQISANVDLAQIKGPGEVEVPVIIEGIKGGLQLVQDYNVKLTVDKIASKTIPITLKLEDGGKQELGYHYSQMNPDHVWVRGPESIIRRISRGQTTLKLEQTDSIIERSLPIDLLDEKGSIIESSFVSLDPEYSIITVYPYKLFFVEPTITGVPAEGYVEVGREVIPQSVFLSGDAEVLNDRDTIGTEMMDIQGATGDVRMNLKLQLYQGLYFSPGQRETVQVLIRIEKLVERTLEIENIDISNIPEGLNAKVNYSNPIAVTISGPESIVNNVNEDQIRLYIDLSDARRGTKRFPIKMEELPANIELRAIDPVNVSVRLE